MMSDDMLSQDEIDALLKGTEYLAEEEESNIDLSKYISEMETDALGEIGNISFGSSATALSTLLNQKVEITTPSVTVISRTQLAEAFPQPYVAIEVSYTEGFSGSNLLVVQQKDAAIIADLMLGGDGQNPSDLTGEIQLSAVQEAMNQMMGSAATSMSTIFSKRVDISPPSIDLLDVNEGTGTDRIPEDDVIVKISFRLKVGTLIDSNIMQILPIDFAKSLVEDLLNPGNTNEQPSATIEKEEINHSTHGSNEQTINNKDVTVFEQQSQNQAFQPVNEVPMPNQQQYQQQYQQQIQYASNQNYGMNQMMQQTTQTQNFQPQHFGTGYPGAAPNIQPAVFSQFEPYQLQESETRNLNMLMDIPLQVTVELGRTKRSVKEILDLASGSIIELDKLAGEPVDILVNNRLIAKGEVVVIDENFGVRVTDIISQSDRIKKLR